MRVFYCDHFELPLPDGHRFPIEKYQLAREKLRSRLADAIRFEVAPGATRDQLAVVHTRDYLDRVFSGSLSSIEEKRIGFPWSEKMLERSRRSTGATIATAQAALHEGVAVHLSGGTHHAFSDEGQGFCVFNDVAVAATLLLQANLAQKIVIVDLDVHQGNGTASIFAKEQRVFTFSIHGDKNFPFRKTEGDLDIALQDGIADLEYVRVLREAFDRAIPWEGCDFVFYIAGADPYRHDRMGRLHLSIDGLQNRDRLVLTHCRDKIIPVAIVMGGGYGPVDEVAEIHANTAELAHHFWSLP